MDDLIEMMNEAEKNSQPQEVELYLNDEPTKNKQYLRCPHCEEGHMLNIPNMSICACTVCSFTMSKDDVKSQIIKEVEEIRKIITKKK